MSIKLEGVSKIYKTGEIETYALRNISLEINKGEFIVILGPSGSGKSTLLNVISGLDTPTNGKIFFNEEEISSYNEEKLTLFRRKYLGFIFQQYNLFQNLTVRENINMGANLSKNPIGIDKVVNKWGLREQIDKYPSQLAGGQQQRVSIARSIVKKPEILFCDEPTGALDEETAREVLNLMQEVNREFNATTVVITHNQGIAAMADRVIKMNSGNIKEIFINKEKKNASEIIWG